MAPSPRKSPRKKRTVGRPGRFQNSPVKQVQKQAKVKARRQGGKKKQSDEASSTSSKRVITVPWSNKAYHHYTDTLLTLIEENEQYKQAFGFEKGTSTPVNSGGKKPIDICRSLAQKVLLADTQSEWADKTVVELGEAIKNRIYYLRTTYNKHCASISETGQGLLDEGREDEIAEGSTLWNIWDKIKCGFPWYMRMHALMGTSPVADCSAVGNSSTDVDLEVLGVRRNSGKPEDEGLDDFDDDDLASKKLDSDVGEDSLMQEPLQHSVANDSDNEGEVDSHCGSPGLDDNREASSPPTPIKKKPATSAREPLQAKVASNTPTLSTVSTASTRRSKGLFGELQTQIDAQQKANIAITKANNEARLEVEKVRQQAKIKVQKLQLEAAKEERKARMAHERELMRMQLEYQQRVMAPPVHTQASSSPAFPSRTSSGGFSSDISLDLSTYGSDSNPASFSFDRLSGYDFSAGSFVHDNTET